MSIDTYTTNMEHQGKWWRMKSCLKSTSSSATGQLKSTISIMIKLGLGAAQFHLLLVKVSCYLLKTLTKYKLQYQSMFEINSLILYIMIESHQRLVIFSSKFATNQS